MLIFRRDIASKTDFPYSKVKVDSIEHIRRFKQNGKWYEEVCKSSLCDVPKGGCNSHDDVNCVNSTPKKSKFAKYGKSN